MTTPEQITPPTREEFAEALHEALGRDDWGAANDDERQEMLDATDALIKKGLLVVTPTLPTETEDLTEGLEFGYHPNRDLPIESSASLIRHVRSVPSVFITNPAAISAGYEELRLINADLPDSLAEMVMVNVASHLRAGREHTAMKVLYHVVDLTGIYRVLAAMMAAKA